MLGKSSSFLRLYSSREFPCLGLGNRFLSSFVAAIAMAVSSFVFRALSMLFWSASFSRCCWTHICLCHCLQGKEALPWAPGVARPLSGVRGRLCWAWFALCHWVEGQGITGPTAADPAVGMAQLPVPSFGTGSGSPAGAFGLPLI